MGFLDDFISTTKNVAATAGKKTDEAVQYSKLKIKAAQLNSDIKNKFEKLGALIYQMAKADEKNDEAFDAIMAEIDACYEELESIEAKLDELKNEVACPGCGAKTKNDNSYCPKCGTKLPERPVTEEESEEPEQTIDAPEEKAEVIVEEKKDKE